MKDIATMMVQEKELDKFNRNEGKSTGRGPNKSVRNARDRREQIRIAEEFVNILEDDDAIRQEAEEALNPVTFIPRGKAKHKPSKRTSSQFKKTNLVRRKLKQQLKQRRFHQRSQIQVEKPRRNLQGERMHQHLKLMIMI